MSFLPHNHGRQSSEGYIVEIEPENILEMIFFSQSAIMVGLNGWN